MAALGLCPSGGLVVSASQLSFSTLSPRILQPFGRRDNASLLSLKTSMGRMGHGGLRHRHALGAQKGTEEGPDPDDDKKRAVTDSSLPACLLRTHTHALAKAYNMHYWKSVLCRVPETLPSAKSRGTRQSNILPSAALGKIKHSVKLSLPSAKHSAKKSTRQNRILPSAKRPAKKSARQIFSPINGGDLPSNFAERLT